MVQYRWLDHFAKQYRLTACEVVRPGRRTAVIRLLGFGRNGRPPGTLMRVHLGSLVGYSPPKPLKPPESPPGKDWRNYCYFE